MSANHDRAAKSVAKRFGGKYDPKRSPDVKAPGRRIEVKSYATEIPKALKQLGNGSATKKYVVLPKPEHGEAKRRLKGTGVGLVDYKGNIVKRPRRS